MDAQRRAFTFDRVVRLALTAALVFGVVWALGYLSDVLIPFAVALLLAYLMNPLVTLIEGKLGNRIAAVLVSLLVVGVGLVAVGAVVTPAVLSEVGHTGKVLSAMVRDSEVAQRAAQRLPPDLWQAIREYAGRPEVQEFFSTDRFKEMVLTAGRKVVPGAWGLLTGTLTFLMSLFGLATIALYLIFLLIDYRRVREGWQELVPPGWREPVVSFAADFNAAMSRYFRAQAAVAAITGVLLAVGFAVIGLPMAVLLGLFVGLLNMVPYLQLVGLIPAVFFAFIHSVETGTSFWVVLGLVLLVFAVVQLIQDGLLVPRIMGRVTGLSPAVILLSLSVWGKLLGMLGLLIALPMTCLLLAYYRRLIASAEEEQPGPLPATEAGEA